MKSIFHTATQVPELLMTFDSPIVSIGPHLSRYDEPPYSFYKFGYSIGDIEIRDCSHRRSFIVLTHIEVSANPQKQLERENK